MTNVAVMIVSHSPDIAKGAADMVRQMVGDDVVIGFTGGAPGGGLGTDVTAIKSSIEQIWTDAGVAVFVDLGGAELNSEMAIEMFDEAIQEKIRICNAPIIEGVVVAGVEASAGSTLQEVVAVAESVGS